MPRTKAPGLNVPSTAAGRKLVKDLTESLTGLDPLTQRNVVQMVTSGVILAEREKATEVQRQITGG